MADIDVKDRAAKLVDRLLGRTDAIGEAARAEAMSLFPDVKLEDPAAPFKAIVEPLKSKLAELEAEREARLKADAEREQRAAEARAEAELRMKLEATRKSFNLTDAGMDAVIERMKSTGNYSAPEDAAAFVLKDEKPVQTRSASLGPQAADFLGRASQEDMDRAKLLWTDPDGAFLDYEIAKMESDPDKYARTYAPEFFNS